jgi:hypothetical protein
MSFFDLIAGTRPGNPFALDAGKTSARRVFEPTVSMPKFGGGSVGGDQFAQFMNSGIPANVNLLAPNHQLIPANGVATRLCVSG